MNPPISLLSAQAIWNERSPFDELFDETIVCIQPSDLELAKPDCLILWGGEDISPSIYKQHPAYHYTDAQVNLSRRDLIEVNLALKAIELKIPILGICRGAQLMCALSGGSLIQHVEKHAIWGQHPIITKENKEFQTNSVHHQMMNPFKVDHHELLAWTPTKLSAVYIGHNNEHVKEASALNWKEPEIVWFPTTHALCIQGHPEYASAKPPFVEYCLKLTKEYLLSKPKSKDATHSPSLH